MHDVATDGVGSTDREMREPQLAAVCIGRAEKIAGKSYKTGINKIAVRHPVMIGQDGIVGDAICNGKYHGGLDQAVLLEGEKTLEWWAEQLDRPIAPGLFGENLVISDLDNRDVAAGDTFLIGSELILQATSPRTPCGTLSARMSDAAFAQAYRKAARPGIYCRVLTPGIVTTGDPSKHVRFDGAGIPIPEMLEKFGKRLSEDDAQRYLKVPIHARMRASILAGGRARF